MSEVLLLAAAYLLAAAIVLGIVCGRKRQPHPSSSMPMHPARP